MANERESLESVLKGVKDPADRVIRMISWKTFMYWSANLEKVQRIMSAYWAIVAEHGPDEVTRDYLIKQGWTPPGKENVSAASKNSKARLDGPISYKHASLVRSRTVYEDGEGGSRVDLRQEYGTGNHTLSGHSSGYEGR